ncbi:MAG: hypothetical protein QOG53_1535 [Frankiales bacterium]|nr:hypothetical protein [Frankiales bacterium]
MARETKDGDGFQPTPRQIGVAALAVIALIFVFENTRKVKIRFIVPEVSSPLWVALVVSLLVGIVIGLLLQRGRDR